METFEPNEFMDGGEPGVILAIKQLNRMKIRNYVDIFSYYESEKPFFSHLYWAVLHEYDMYKEYEADGMIWIDGMSATAWNTVYHWLNNYRQVFVKSANESDKVNKEKFGCKGGY